MNLELSVRVLAFLIFKISISSLLFMVILELSCFLIKKLKKGYRYLQKRIKAKEKSVNEFVEEVRNTTIINGILDKRMDEVIKLNKQAVYQKLYHDEICRNTNMAAIYVSFGFAGRSMFNEEEYYEHKFLDDVHKYIHDGEFVYEIVEIDMDHTIQKIFNLRKVCDYYGLVFEDDKEKI